jgi:microcystin degradation protein MlrC
VRDWCRAAPEWATLPPDAPRPTKSQGTWEGSNRQYRGRILRALGALPPGDALLLPLLGARVRDGYTEADAPWLLTLVRALARDGLVLLSEEADPFMVRLP